MVSINRFMVLINRFYKNPVSDKNKTVSSGNKPVSCAIKLVGMNNPDSDMIKPV